MTVLSIFRYTVLAQCGFGGRRYVTWDEAGRAFGISGAWVQAILDRGTRKDQWDRSSRPR